MSKSLTNPNVAIPDMASPHYFARWCFCLAGLITCLVFSLMLGDTLTPLIAEPWRLKLFGEKALKALKDAFHQDLPDTLLNLRLSNTDAPDVLI